MAASAQGVISWKAWLAAWWQRWAAVVLVGTVAVCAPVLALVWLPFAQAHNRLLFDGPVMLADGAWIAHHGIPHWMLFTAGPRHRWVDQQWLAQLIDYEMWKAMGYTGLALFKVGVVGATYTGLAVLIRGRCASHAVVIGCGLMALAGGLVSLVYGSQELVLPLFVIMLAVCGRDVGRRRPDGWLLAVVALCVVWANLFSLALGAGFAIAYLVARAAMMVRQQMWPWALGCLALAFVVRLTPLATPYGTEMIHYYRAIFVQHMAGPRVPGAYAPVPGQPVFFAVVIPLALVVAAALAALMRREKVSTFALAFVMLTGIGAGMAVRNIPFFEVTAALFIAHLAQGWVAEHRAGLGVRRAPELSLVWPDFDRDIELEPATPEPAVAAGG